MNPDTEFLLSQWATWTRINPGKPKGYPKRSPFASSFSGSDLVITDDQAIKIDSAVKKLLNRDLEIGKATVDYFFCGKNLSLIARRLNTSRRTAEKWITAGVSWIDGALILDNFYS